MVSLLPAGLIRVLREPWVSLFPRDTWFMPNMNQSRRKRVKTMEEFSRELSQRTEG